MKHTKGPWIIKNDDHHINAIFNQDGERVATNLGETRNEHENLTLIAAAPEMLEALEEVESYMFSYDSDGCEEDERIYTLIKKVIKKAKGE